MEVARLTKPDPFKFPPKIKLVARKIAEAAGTAIDAYAREQITDEPSITDRWIGAVEAATTMAPSYYSRRTTGLTWRAKTLRPASGRAAEEKRHGADLLGVADIHIGGNVVRKGFLGQAKRTEPGQVFDPGPWKDLEDQAKTMLSRSSESFVLIYSKRHGIRFIPAISIANLGRRDLFDFNSMSLEKFFQLHLACFIGDPQLNGPHISKLDDLMALNALHDFPIRYVLHIMVSYDEIES
jgi:hypothetical protein